jgi:hypothetical protein
VHGLAFASSLPGRDLGRAQAAWKLLGFNTGVELAPLGLLFLVAPWRPGASEAGRQAADAPERGAPGSSY